MSAQVTKLDASGKILYCKLISRYQGVSDYLVTMQGTDTRTRASLSDSGAFSARYAQGDGLTEDECRQAVNAYIEEKAAKDKEWLSKLGL